MGTPIPGLGLLDGEGDCECPFFGMGGKGLADPGLLIGVDFGAADNDEDGVSPIIAV